MYNRAATSSDLLAVLCLYREYNQAEPCSVSLGLPAKHLETHLAIIASFKRLIECGCVLVCCEGETVLGMGVHYSLSVCPRTQEDIESLTVWLGYPELAPAFVLSNTAVHSSALATHYRAVSQSASLRYPGVKCLLVASFQQRQIFKRIDDLQQAATPTTPSPHL